MKNNNMVLKVGITGGIGSGKSLVCKLFKILKVPVFEADLVAKDLLDHNGTIKNELIHLFGREICTAEQTIDRKKLASIIFNDNLALQKVNSIIHPKVKDSFFEWVANQDTPYILHEAAILFESGFYRLMDFNILITADRELRISRVMKRDGVDREEVLKRMRQQWPDEEKERLAQVIIRNENELIIPKVLEIDKKLKDHGKIW